MHIDSIKTAEISLTSTNAKKFLSYGDEAREPGKFSKSDLFRAMASNERSSLQLSID